MKSGKCPKCKQRNVSKCESSENRTFRREIVDVECSECGGTGELGLHKCNACQWSGTMKADAVATMKPGELVTLPTGLPPIQWTSDLRC